MQDFESLEKNSWPWIVIVGRWTLCEELSDDKITVCILISLSYIFRQTVSFLLS